MVERDVAQSGSAPQWGCGGRWFESSRPDHLLQQERTLDWVRTSEAGLPATARQRKLGLHQSLGTFMFGTPRNLVGKGRG